MRKAIGKKIISLLFLSIFFGKMTISVAPLIIAHLDSEAVNAVIMQLEIEHSKASDGKEFSAKEFIMFDTFCLNLTRPPAIITSIQINTDQDKHNQLFYPSVPTPPPNA